MSQKVEKSPKGGWGSALEKTLTNLVTDAKPSASNDCDGGAECVCLVEENHPHQ